MAIRIEVVEGPLAGQAFTLEGPGSYIFGRGEQARCRLTDDPSISRQHFAVDVDDRRVLRLRDLGSINGVLINDRKIGGRHGDQPDESELHHGDRVRVGRAVLLVNAPTQGLASDARTLIVSPSRLDAAPRGVDDVLARFDADGNSARAAALTELPGYDSLVKIGSGAWGDVYRARRAADGRDVAVKTMNTVSGDPEKTWVRFQREIEITRSLAHPNVVEFIDHGRIGNALYLVLEYMGGGDLEQRLRTYSGPMPPAEALDVMIQVLEGMTVAHRKGIVHRDLKPSNVLFADATLGTAKVADLGMAKNVMQSAQFTATGSGGGTPAYMAPEQITGFRHATPAADVFSLTATLYELLCRRPAYNFAPGKDYLNVILDGDIVPLSARGTELPTTLIIAVDRGLARDPAERHADADAMLADLRPVRALFA